MNHTFDPTSSLITYEGHTILNGRIEVTRHAAQLSQYFACPRDAKMARHLMERKCNIIFMSAPTDIEYHIVCVSLPLWSAAGRSRFAIVSTFESSKEKHGYARNKGQKG